MGVGTQIKRIRDLNDLSAVKMASLIGVDVERLRKWESKNLNPRREDSDKIEEFFKVPISELSKIDKIVYSSKNVPREAAKRRSIDMVDHSPPEKYLYELIESNRILADATKTAAESDKIKAEANKKLIESNAALAGLLKHSMETVTVKNAEENPLTEPETIRNILLLMARIGSGQRWDSEEAALKEINNTVYARGSKKKQVGNHAGSHKSNIS